MRKGFVHRMLACSLPGAVALLGIACGSSGADNTGTSGANAGSSGSAASTGASANGLAGARGGAGASGSSGVDVVGQTGAAVSGTGVSGIGGTGSSGAGGGANSGAAGGSGSPDGGDVAAAQDAGTADGKDGATASSGMGDADGGGSMSSPEGGASDAAAGAPGVRIVGRTAPGTTAGSVRFSWPGVNFSARFTGTQASMNVNDGNNKNRFTVVVDNGTPKTLTTTSGQSSLPLASGLQNGTHSLVVWRNTEASFGVTTFLGLSNFGAGGALLAPDPGPDRRIEVIGDSLSVGAGVLGTSTTCSPGIDAFSDNYLAYGTVAARAVSADVVTIAWSGIGVYRSYNPSDPTMPQRYDYAIPNDQTPWDFTKYQPQVVVLNLGTNDFGAGNPGQPYVDAYVAFIKHVRSKYAAANMILIDMYGGDRLTAINSVVSTLKSGGETKVEALSFSSVPNNNTACNGHPNVAAQQAMGTILATRLKSLMGWQ